MRPPSLRHRRPVPAAALTGAAALALLAAGCSSSNIDPSCPRVAILDELGRVTKFREGAGRDLTDVAYTAQLRNADGFCSFDKSGVKIEMKVALVAERGPAAAGPAADVQYFVAITDANRRVIAKEVFPTRLQFADNQRLANATEEIEERIPLPRGSDASAYSIVLGFQLSPDEIAYNRRRVGG